MKRVYFYDHSDIKWSFTDSSRPTISLDTAGDWRHSESVDPFPCYMHDKKLVISEVKRVEAKVPLPRPPRWFVLPYETLSRTNGWASYNKYAKEPANPYIVLAGKRICLHPSMTRYLVAHEYGHLAHWSLKTILTPDSKDDAASDGDFEKDYAKMRGVKYSKEYGALKWHTNIGEVIANDIRVLLLDAETDFWQHECQHPLEHKKTRDYWRAMRKHFK